MATVLFEDPELPKPDRHGRFPALAYARISLARDLVRHRRSLGLSQQRMAELAGIRRATLSRLEAGTHTAGKGVVDKIMRVIESEKRGKKRIP
jgi:predicted transcriptional regulator